MLSKKTLLNSKEILLADGKYSVTNNNGILSTKRYGEPWSDLDNDLVGFGFVLALVQKIEDLQKDIENLKLGIDTE